MRTSYLPKFLTTAAIGLIYAGIATANTLTINNDGSMSEQEITAQIYADNEHLCHSVIAGPGGSPQPSTINFSPECSRPQLMRLRAKAGGVVTTNTVLCRWNNSEPGQLNLAARKGTITILPGTTIPCRYK